MIPEHRILIDEETIRERIEELSRVIAADLGHRNPVLLGLMMGSFLFLGDLVRALSRRGVEPKVDLLGVSHYGMSTEPGGDVRIDRDTSIDLSGEAVIVVDDILDSGRSLQAVLRHLDGRGPAWLRTCVFLNKPSRRTVPVEADYVGFDVPDEWIIGYGLDFKHEARGLPYIGAVDARELERHGVLPPDRTEPSDKTAEEESELA